MVFNNPELLTSWPSVSLVAISNGHQTDYNAPMINFLRSNKPI